MGPVCSPLPAKSTHNALHDHVSKNVDSVVSLQGVMLNNADTTDWLSDLELRPSLALP